jgi:DNA-directed RNA polymerase subunit RPC12/RpoP
MANRICAWCKKIMGPALTEEDTHGACDECAEKVLSELKLGGRRGVPASVQIHLWRQASYQEAPTFGKTTRPALMKL